MRGPEPVGAAHVSGRELHGPLSPVGAAIGVVLVAVPFAFTSVDTGVAWAAWVAGPVVGLLLLVVPGRARQLGIGLVASALTFPLLLMALGLLVIAP